jgi:hypothetical protein
MSERPSVLERLSTALNSSDLTFDPIHRGDLDFVAALGIASSRHSAVAGPVMRVHLAGTPDDLRAAFNAVLGLVKRLNAKRNWRLMGHSIQVVALQSLSHHVNPVCPHCSGRKFELQEGSPVLSTKACTHCRGTGRRQVQKKHRDQIGQVIAALESIDEVTERAVARLVR